MVLILQHQFLCMDCKLREVYLYFPSFLKTRLKEEGTCLLFIHLIQEKKVRFKANTEAVHELSSLCPGSDGMNCKKYHSTAKKGKDLSYTILS